jgi:hypothetical protein
MNIKNNNQVETNNVPFKKLCILIFAGSLTFVAPAQASEGLWVGAVRLDAVSEVNKPRSDLSFDLSLAGQLEGSPTVLIAAHSANWKFQDNGLDLGTQWRDPGYVESGWFPGTAPLGYGDGDEVTVVSSGPSASEKNPVTYFRKSFNVADSSTWSDLNISLVRDDGAVVYLNGTEVMRSNMPDGAIGFNSQPLEAVGSNDENRYFQQSIPSALLVNGKNVIAVEVHQHAAELTPFEGTAPPAPTASTLTLRLLLHENTSGGVNLLKQVIQMWQDGTLKPDGTLDEAGHYVLLTDDTLIPQYEGVGLRDSTLVGLRISAVGFDFPGEQTPLTGSLDVNQTVTGSFTLPGNHPTHPRRHQYHPEHDNLNANYTGSADEVGAIERTITLDISGSYAPDPDNPPPGWGETQLGGIYTEVITGLHRDPIEMTGVFTLNRVSDRGLINE